MGWTASNGLCERSEVEGAASRPHPLREGVSSDRAHGRIVTAAGEGGVTGAPRVRRCGVFRVSVDRHSGVPIYLQIRDQITYEISVSSLAAGTVLPSIRQVATEAGVATATVRRAYAELVEDGYVVSHQGKGMLVAELEHREPTGAVITSHRVRAQVLSLFSSAIGRAFALGVDADGARSAFVRAMERWTGSGYVLFVGTEPEFLEHYGPLLASSLDDVDVRVVATDLVDVERRIDLSDAFSYPICVVTLVRSYGAVRRVFGPTRIPIVGLTLNLSDATKLAIADLPRTAHLALVSERMSLKGIRALVEQHLISDHALDAHPLDGEGAVAAVQRADVVIPTLRGRRFVRTHRTSGGAMLELQFEPAPVSIHRLRRTVEEERSKHPGHEHH